jgi:hypothetical protein
MSGQVRTGSHRFGKIQKISNLEPDPRFGPVLPKFLNLNSGPVRVRFRFGIGSEPDTGNTILHMDSTVNPWPCDGLRVIQDNLMVQNEVLAMFQNNSPARYFVAPPPTFMTFHHVCEKKTPSTIRTIPALTDINFSFPSFSLSLVQSSPVLFNVSQRLCGRECIFPCRYATMHASSVSRAALTTIPFVQYATDFPDSNFVAAGNCTANL